MRESQTTATDLDVTEASPVSDPVGLTAGSIDIGDFGDRNTELAAWTNGVVLGRLKNDFPTGVEARLTEEVSNLAAFLAAWSSRANRICEVLPFDAKLGKLVALTISSTCLHLSNALMKDLNLGVFAEDGGLYLKQIGLKFEDCVRELDLDGVRFFCVANSKHSLSNGNESLDA